MVMLLKICFKALVDHFSIGGNDPRTNDLPLVNNYFLILSIIGVYMLVVLKIGPKFMAKRKPYKVETIMQIYNIFQIIINLYIFYGITKYFSLRLNYSWICNPYDRTDNSETLKAIRKYAYIYYLNKILDFMDTIFFVLRKKFNQISFLHVYHHAAMVWGGFIYFNIFFGSQFTVIGHINSLVHVLMYFYYFVSALNKEKFNLDSWKPYITQIQILQFAYFAIKFLVIALNNSRCNLPSFWLGLLLIQNTFMTVMFTHFYLRTYTYTRIAKNSQKLKI